MNPSFQSHHLSRRRSPGNSSASPVFPGTSDQSSAPAMNNRQMPPPSPPQHYPTARIQSANAPPLPTPFLSREHPSNPAHRPGSSMSISSMLGSDADRPARDIGPSPLFSRPPVSSSSSPYAGAPPLPANPAVMSPPTAPARPSLDYPLYRRSQTPEKSFAKNHSPARPYRSSSGGIPQTSITEQPKFGPLSRAPAPASQYPEKPSSSHPSPPISSAESVCNESRRLSLNGSIPRPNSQPHQVEAPARPSGYSPLSRPTPMFGGEGAAAFGTTQHRPAPFSEHGRFGSLYSDRQSEEFAHRERERAMAQERYGAYGDREPAGRQHAPGAWEFGRSQPPSPEAKRFPEPGPGFGFGAIQSYTKSLGSQLGGPRPSISSQPGHNQQPTPSPSEHGPYLPKLQTEPPRRFNANLSTGPSPLTNSASDDRRTGSDELIHHRNLLGVGSEKRGGRDSPLPQAVQGALGPGGESSIKNDLGRVFSGIGSGVGGVTAPTVGSGHSTPIMSPFKRDSAAARSTNGDTTDDTRVARPGSTTGKRYLKSRDEDNQLIEDEGVDQRTGVSGRGRRGRHGHHHHHQYVPFP